MVGDIDMERTTPAVEGLGFHAIPDLETLRKNQGLGKTVSPSGPTVL